MADNVSTAEEIDSIIMGRPHVVLLGAGASVAACPRGDRAGKRLPVMANLTEVVPLGDLLPPCARGENFEAFYSKLAQNPDEASRCRKIEEVIYDYFDGLLLPDAPTIYDYLLLSLRPKDVIATFNWDPFLMQALYRNGEVLDHKYPQLLFLHGNVLEGFCDADKVIGRKGNACSQCGRPLEPSRLLYPVEQKNYRAQLPLADTWNELEDQFKDAFMVTIFGYSAPKSDTDALSLLKAAWGDWRNREFEQFELIDIRNEEDLVASWDDFIHSHHYQTASDFFDSSFGLHPRRTGEDYWFRNMMVRWTTPNRPPQGVSLRELQAWFRPLIDAERVAASKKAP
jgi:hypothetical protein